MDLINKIKKALIDPIKFFENLKKEIGIKDAFLYLLILSLFATILGVIVGYFMQSVSLNMFSKIFGFTFPKLQYTFGFLFFWAIIGYGLGLLFSFVVAGLLHVWILIFGGKADYTKTYQLYVYSRTPGFVFGWIPFIGYFIWIYNLILLIIGTQKVHDISKLRAILMYVIPLGIIFLFYILIFVLVIFVIKSNPDLILKAIKT